MCKEFKRCNIEKISYFILNINRLKMIKIKFKCPNFLFLLKSEVWYLSNSKIKFYYLLYIWCKIENIDKSIQTNQNWSQWFDF